MSTIEERLTLLEREHTEIKERVATLDGSFQFVSGQLRNLQTYMHDRFDKVDARFDKVDARLDRIEADVRELKSDVRDIKSELKALPRAIAEIIKESRS